MMWLLYGAGLLAAAFATFDALARRAALMQATTIGVFIAEDFDE